MKDKYTRNASIALLLISSALFLASCGALHAEKGYEGRDLAFQEIGIIRPNRSDDDEHGYRTTFLKNYTKISSSVDAAGSTRTSSPEQIHMPGTYQIQPSPELHLKPGAYMIQLWCRRGVGIQIGDVTWSSFPTVVVSVEPGMVYLLDCKYSVPNDPMTKGTTTAEIVDEFKL